MYNFLVWYLVPFNWILTVMTLYRSILKTCNLYFFLISPVIIFPFFSLNTDRIGVVVNHGQRSPHCRCPRISFLSQIIKFKSGLQKFKFMISVKT